MKRNKSEKNPEAEVIVESRAYGRHTRKPRGTYKEAKLNDSLKTATLHLGRANIEAALLKNEIDQYRLDFPGGLFWQRLLSVFRACYKKEEKVSFSLFKDFEVHTNYRLSRFIRPQVSEPVFKQGFAEMRIAYRTPPDFKRKFVDAYHLGLIAVGINFEQNLSGSSIAWTEHIPLDHPGPMKHSFVLPLAANCPDVLFILKIQAISKGVPVVGCPNSGMLCVWGGSI